MCQMKRDVVAMTGVWYHGGEDGPAEQTMKLKSKISHSEIESSDVSRMLQMLLALFLSQRNVNNRT